MAPILHQSPLETTDGISVRSFCIHHPLLQSHSPELVSTTSSPAYGRITSSTGTSQDWIQGTKGSLRYSRDDVHPALRLQGIIRESILTGWRPTVPQHRGSQSALVEPTVGVIEQCSKDGTMSFKWFLFGSTPEPTIYLITAAADRSARGG